MVRWLFGPLSILAVAVVVGGCTRAPAGAPNAPAAQQPESPQLSVRRVELATLSPTYRLSAELPDGWQVEYVPGSEAVNVYDPSRTADSNLERSVIFLRYFKADRFLTLQTVEILERSDATVGSHPAVRYRIRKRPEVAAFANQPSWRSVEHRLIDVRLAPTGQTTFFVIAANPKLEAETFERFVASLRFHNDADQFISSLSQPTTRASLKRFGQYIAPGQSPVDPERFRGFHTAADLELLPGEQAEQVTVRAVCGGPLKLARRSSGYGGVAVQGCLRGLDEVTVVYGHLRLESISAAVGSYLVPGQELGTLGRGYSSETDGERPHLHLGVHRGSAIDIRGYVIREAELASWLDPLSWWPS